jgi:O-antigen/teichoic acid export membrane protein
MLVLYAAVVSYFLNTGTAADFASISLLLLVFSYIQLLDLGIGYAVTQRFGRAVAAQSADGVRLLRTALPMYLICAAVASLVLVGAAELLSTVMFKSDQYAAAIRLLAVGVWPLFLSAFVSAILQALNKLVWINASRTLLEFFKAAAFLVAATAPEPVTTAVAITVGGAFARLALDVAIAGRLTGGFAFLSPTFSRTEMGHNLSLGWPMVIALILGIVNTLADRIFVSRVLGPEDLAHYTLAYDVNSKAFFLVGAVSAALYTPILRRSATARPQRPLLLVSYLSVAAVAAAYFLPLAAFAEPILEWWINPEIAGGAAAVTRVAALMGVTYLSMSVVFNALQASGRALTVMNGTIVASCVLLGGLALMPVEYGAGGVMTIVTLSFFAQLLVYASALSRSTT